MTSTSLSTTGTSWYSVRQWRIFQAFFGLYLAYHFYQLIPHTEELFGRHGMISNPQWNPTYSYFFNILHLIDHSAILLQLFLGCLTVLSILFAFRVCYPRFVALCLWYGWACLLNRNVLISNPGIPYVGLLLLAFSLITLTPTKTHDHFELNPHVFPWIYWGGWTLYALGYTVSGLHKLQSPSWLDGSALHHVLRSPLSRDHFLCHYLLEAHPIILQMSTWASLLAEISFLPLGIFYHTRKYYWWTFLALHFGVLLLVNFTDLTLGVLMMHFFLLDMRWFRV